MRRRASAAPSRRNPAAGANRYFSQFDIRMRSTHADSTRRSATPRVANDTSDEHYNINVGGSNVNNVNSNANANNNASALNNSNGACGSNSANNNNNHNNNYTDDGETTTTRNRAMSSNQNETRSLGHFASSRSRYSRAFRSADARRG
jgi:hypothetical protein